MTVIKDEILINCSPEPIFKEISSIDFLKHIGASPGVENIITYQNNRLAKYVVKGRFNNIQVSMESERIVIPESLTVVTQRRNMPGIKYALNLFVLKKQDKSTVLSLIEEFEKEDGEPDAIALENNIKRNRALAETIVRYFDGKK